MPNLRSDKGPVNVDFRCLVHRNAYPTAALDEAINTVQRELPTLYSRNHPNLAASLEWLPASHESARMGKHPMWDSQATAWAYAQLRVRLHVAKPSFAAWFPDILVEDVLAQLALICDLACPGRIALIYPVMFVNDVPVDWRVALPGLYFADAENILLTRLEASLGIKDVGDGPLFPMLSPALIKQWLTSLPGYSYGVGEQRVGRALSALTHLQRPDIQESDLPQLIWSVLGLEALFGSEEDSRAQSIRDGVVKMFGPDPYLEQWIGEMYDMRSKLVHGRCDLPMAGSFRSAPRNDRDAQRQRRIEKGISTPLTRAVATANYLLVAALRHHALVPAS